jgi:hypothetical protein
MKPTGTRLHSGGIRSSVSGKSTVLSGTVAVPRWQTCGRNRHFYGKKLNNTEMLAVSIWAVAATLSTNWHATNALIELKQPKTGSK